MYELPLFPLNTVLFPGTPLQLHIFEERYKDMIARCLQEHRPFGVVLIRKGMEALGPLADPFMIGCTAQIIEAERVAQGRMNITAIGKERFRVLSLNRNSHAYLVGMVESYPLAQAEPESLRDAGDLLDPWVRRYFELLIESGNIELDLEQLPGDPLLLAFMSAAVLQIPPLQKQRLLSLHDAESFLTELRKVFRRETALLKALVAESVPEGPFSVN